MSHEHGVDPHDWQCEGRGEQHSDPIRGYRNWYGDPQAQTQGPTNLQTVAAGKGARASSSLFPILYGAACVWFAVVGLVLLVAPRGNGQVGFILLLCSIFCAFGAFEKRGAR